MRVTLFTATAACRVDHRHSGLSNGGQSMGRWLAIVQRPTAQLQLFPVHLLALVTEQLVDQHAADHGHENTDHRQAEEDAQT